MNYTTLKSQVIQNGAPALLCAKNMSAQEHKFFKADNRIDAAYAICGLIACHIQMDYAANLTDHQTMQFMGKMIDACSDLDINLDAVFTLYLAGKDLQLEATKWML